MQIDATRHLNPSESHKEFFRNSDEELLFYGGAGSGKSYSAADKLILAPILWKQPITGIAAGPNLPFLKRTSVRLLEKRLTEFGIPYELNRTDLIFRYYTGTSIESTILMIGTHESDRTQGGRLKSITDIDLIWVEELTEVDEEGYEELIRRLRGGYRTPVPGAVAPYRQIYSTFNPIGIASWVYERFWINEKGLTVPRIHTMARRDNPFDQEYARRLDDHRAYSEMKYRVYALGEWAELEDLIYAGYSTVPYWELPKGDQILETIHGLDFGFNHPCALVTIHILKDGAILRERMYQTGLRTSDLIESLRDLNLGKEPIYADTARPDLISELRLAGYNVLDADKSSVIDSISYCQKLMPFLRVSDDSTNLLKELKSYQWAKGPNGVLIDKPVKLHDDLLDGARYALFTHRYRIPFGRQRSHMPEKKSIVPQWWRDLIGDGGQQRTGAMGL
jgi:phage terminase large subunit